MTVRFCQKCHTAVMRPHHELIYWFKCPICGYCEFNLDLLHENVREKAKRNKFASTSAMYDEKTWKPWLGEDDDD